MATIETTDYHQIAATIEYIQENSTSSRNLDEIAKNLHLSPAHFQRLFTGWAGTSPERFLQYINVQYAKKLLKQEQGTLLDVSFESGRCGNSRIHSQFISIEGMTPSEYKDKAHNMHINYSFDDSPFGSLIIASTHKGVCYMAFEEEEEKAFSDLKAKFPNAVLERKSDFLQQNALFIFQHNESPLPEIKLHVKGTDFQLKVWQSLLKIPTGTFTTYGRIAEEIQNPKASRAVGTAIGNNPVAFLIPCHRVIQSSGVFGGYMWGSTRKTAIIGWEAAKINSKI